MISRRLRASLLAAAISLSTGLTGGAHAADEPPILPRADCFDLTDQAGDANYKASGTVPVYQQDDKVDITQLIVGEKGRTLLIYLKVPGLDGTTKDSSTNWGPRFDAFISVKGAVQKDIQMINAKPAAGSPYTTLNSDAKFPLLYVGTGGQPVADSTFSSTFDLTNKFMTFSIDLDSVAAKTAKETPIGTELTIYADAKVLARTALSKNVNAVSMANSDDVMDYVPDTATASPAVRFTYHVGESKCFGPPKSKLAGLVGTTVQYGDAANLVAKLTNEAGDKAVAGKQVTFSIDGKSATGTTGADGVARAALAHGKAAGTYPLTVKFAGDDSYATSELEGTLTVKQETTKIPTPFKIAKSGKNRTVTVNVADDDRAAVGGQAVNWWVNGKKAATKNTDGKGNAVFTAAAGQTVYAELPAVTGKYLATKSASTKLA